MTGMLLYLAISIFISIYQPFFALFFMIYIFTFKSYKYKLLFILLFTLFTYRTTINACQPITSGKIVELNNKSIVVNHNFTNVLVSVQDITQYSLQDEIVIYASEPLDYSPHFYGFNLENWSKSRNICYKTSEQDTYKRKGWGLLNWLSNGGFNTNPKFIMLNRILLFQSNPGQELNLFISMGIIYTLMIKLIQLFTLKRKYHPFETLLISVIFLYLCINLAWPLSLVRVWVFYIVSKYINDKILRFSLNLIICAFINPFGLTQLAYVLPLMFQFTAIFLPLKSKYIQRSLVLIILIISFNHSISIVNILIYPFLFGIYRGLIIVSVVLSIIPIFSSAFVYFVELVDMIYQLSLNYGVLKGHISIFFIIFYLFVYHVSNHHKIIQLVLMNTVVLIGVRAFSIPFFYTVTMINVGQGDSFLIQAPFNQSVILIDTGPPNQYKALKAFLDAQSIDRIDYLIITHDDNDHSGNIDMVTRDYTINEIVLKGIDIENDWIFMDYLEFIQSDLSDNDTSLVYYINLFNTRFLFLGDLSASGESQLISKYTNLKVDILKLAHHGSKTSTSDDLLKHIQTRIGLISVGINNYGHPSYAVIQRLDEYYIRYFTSIGDGDTKIIMTPFVRFLLNSKNEYEIFSNYPN